MSTSPLAVNGLLFDLDGTLVESAPDIGNAANHMLESLGLEPVAIELIQAWIGNGTPKLVKRALTGDFDGEPDFSLYEKAYPLFIEYYEQHVCVDSYLYPGVAEALKLLHDRGYTLGCVTNKPARCTLPLLNILEIDRYFTAVVSGDTCSHKKPHPEPVLFALNQMGVAPQNCVMVGDSAHDIHAAHAAKLPVIAVNYGYNQGVDLNTEKPLAVIENFADILPLIKSIEG